MASPVPNKGTKPGKGEKPNLTLVSPGPMPSSGHNLRPDDDKIVFFTQQLIAAEAELEVSKAGTKLKAKALGTVSKTAQVHGIPMMELQQARQLVAMKDQEDARRKIAFLVQAYQALGGVLPQGDLHDDPFAQMDATAREAEEWERRGFIDATTGTGKHRGELPDGCPPDRTQDYLRGQERGIKKIENAFLVHNKANPVSAPDAGGNGGNDDGEGDDD